MNFNYVIGKRFSRFCVPWVFFPRIEFQPQSVFESEPICTKIPHIAEKEYERFVELELEKKMS
jgi:hypothetical protein